MNTLLKQIELIEQVDQIICSGFTGTPLELAMRLKVSRRRLLRTLNVMKQLNAPIVFDSQLKSYCYTEVGQFFFGFVNK